jgi:LacI family transcriptional regulator
MSAGARARAADYGYDLAEFWPQDPPGLPLPRLRQILRSRGIDGVLVGPMRRGDDELDFDFTDFSVVALGYSMARPEVHRAVPHHYRMMREMLDELLLRGFRRIGLVLWERMETGFNHLLSAAYFQMQHRLARRDCLDILHIHESPDTVPEHRLGKWLTKETPEVVLAPGAVYATLQRLGTHIPRDLSFINLDLGDPPHHAAGLLAGYDLVGASAMDLLASQLSLDQRGIPAEPKTLMVRSTWRNGPTLGSPRGAGPYRPLKPI